MLPNTFHPDRVAVWIIGRPHSRRSETILVLEKYRPNPKWKPPSGSIEYLATKRRFETPEETAHRELEEETGLDEPIDQGNLVDVHYKASHRYHLYSFVVEVNNFKKLRRQGKTGERTLRYPIGCLNEPFNAELLGGIGILQDDLDFLARVRSDRLYVPGQFKIHRFEPSLSFA